MIALSYILIFIFCILAGFHFCWAAGMDLGIQNAIPTKEGEENLLFRPSPIMTAAVGLVLLSFAGYYFTMITSFDLHPGLRKFAGWGIPAIFILRSIGDFNYAGFFKKIKNTRFGKMDTRYFSPLCLIIGILGFLVQYFGV